MSRRRKHGDSPAPKKTPLQAAAAEECSSVVEPGRRRLRSARGSRQQRVAGEGSTWPWRPREQRPAAAWCSKSDPKGETSAARLAGALAPSPIAQLVTGKVGAGVARALCWVGFNPSRVPQRSLSCLNSAAHSPSTGVDDGVYLFGGTRVISRLPVQSAVWS